MNKKLLDFLDELELIVRILHICGYTRKANWLKLKIVEFKDAIN